MNQGKRNSSATPEPAPPLDTAWPGPRARAQLPRRLEAATESLLAAPLPAPPAPPRLHVGRDYLPLPGDPAFDPAQAPRRSTVLWLRVPRRTLHGVLAVLGGFGGGLLLAWLLGLL